MSPLIRFERNYRRSHPNDRAMQNIEYPADWVDNAGCVKDEIRTPADIYLDIKKLQHQNPVRDDTLASIILFERHIRVFTLAYAFTVRKQMLRMRTTEDSFEWDLEIDYEMAKAALKFIKIFDEYVYTLSLIPMRISASNTNTGSQRSEAVAEQDAEIGEERAFKRYIMLRLVTDANPLISSSNLTRKLRRKAFKEMNNLEYIQEVVLNDCPELFRVEEMHHDRVNVRYWMANITRLPLSSVTAVMLVTEKIALLQKLSDLKVTVLDWSLHFGDTEVEWVRANPKF